MHPDKTDSFLQTVLQTIPDLLWVKDADGVYLSCNPSFSRFIGAPESEIVGKTDYDLVDSDTADAFRASDREAIENDDPTSNREWVTFADDGHRALLETVKTPMLDEAGNLVGVLGIAREAIALRAELTLRERERYLRALIDNFPFSVWLKDTGGRFLAANQAFAESCGADDATRITGKSDLDVWPADLAEAHRADDLTVMESRRPRAVEEEIFDQGSREWVETFKAPVLADDGSLLGTVGFSRNISERKSTEESLRRRDALLEGLSHASAWLFAHKLLASADIVAALHELGLATHADRVYIFEHIPGPAGSRGSVSRRYEWASDSAEAQIDNPDLQGFPWEDVAPRWYDTFVAGGHIQGSAADFPDGQQAVLEPQDVESLLALPIESGGGIWGFIGFATCHHERTWHASEVELLRSAASSIAAAIDRMRVGVALRASEDRFRLLAENASDVVFTATNDGAATWFSPSVTPLIGWLPEQLVGRPFVDFVHPRDLPRVQRAQTTAMDGSPAKFEMRVRTAAGD